MPGLTVTLFSVPGKVPLWLEDETMEIGAETETTVGAMIEAGGRRLAYIPGCARVTDGLKARIAGVDALLFDGTVLLDDDMIRAGVGTKTGWRMGHVPMTGRRRLHRGPRRRRDRPARLRAHQQHQPGPGRGSAERAAGRGRGLDRGP